MKIDNKRIRGQPPYKFKSPLHINILDNLSLSFHSNNQNKSLVNTPIKSHYNILKIENFLNTLSIDTHKNKAKSEYEKDITNQSKNTNLNSSMFLITKNRNILSNVNNPSKVNLLLSKKVKNDTIEDKLNSNSRKSDLNNVNDGEITEQNKINKNYKFNLKEYQEFLREQIKEKKCTVIKVSVREKEEKEKRILIEINDDKRIQKENEELKQRLIKEPKENPYLNSASNNLFSFKNLKNGNLSNKSTKFNKEKENSVLVNSDVL